MQNPGKDIEFGERFGYAEMFEWAEGVDLKSQLLCRLVQFDENFPHCIIPAKTIKNIVGITTINSGGKVSNPHIWPYKYILNEYGDLYLRKEEIGFAHQEYDAVNEFSYLKTESKTVHMPINNPDFDEEQKYIPRTNRIEWIQVTLIGKAILEDDGTCEAGQYCTLYKGKDKNLFGTVQLAKPTDKFKLPVLGRISDHTILVFYIPQIYSIDK